MAGLNYMEGTPQKGHTSGEDDANSGEDDSTPVRAIKNEPFAHMYHDDENDPSYDELREELDAIFQNSQLQDITDLPANYSLVSLPFGGEGIGAILTDGGTPWRYGQAVTSWAGLDYEKNVPTPTDMPDATELPPARIDQAVARGRDALFLPTPTPNMVGHNGYDQNTDPAKATVYDPGAVAEIKNCLMEIGPVYAEIS